jgi:adenosine kinase
MQEFFGGTAGNIVYGLSQLGQSPVLLANLGRDGAGYRDYLQAMGVDASYVPLLKHELTAGAYIATDAENNQITFFYAGAMKRPCPWPQAEFPEDSMVIVAPGNLEDMARLPQALRGKGLDFIFDPGQSLPSWHGREAELAQALDRAYLLICNEYEFDMLNRLLRLGGVNDWLQKVKNLVITANAEGSRLYSRGQAWRVGAAPLRGKIVNPTGAGDAYRAGLLASLAKGGALVEACRCGAALAALMLVNDNGAQGYQLPASGLDPDAVPVSAI